MNAKTCKRLRKMAKLLATTISAQNNITISERSYEENERNRKQQVIYKTDGAGNRIVSLDNPGQFEVERVVDISLGTISNAKNTVRGIYRKLKSDLIKEADVLGAIV